MTPCSWACHGFFHAKLLTANRPTAIAVQRHVCSVHFGMQFRPGALYPRKCHSRGSRWMWRCPPTASRRVAATTRSRRPARCVSGPLFCAMPFLDTWESCPVKDPLTTPPSANEPPHLQRPLQRNFQRPIPEVCKRNAADPDGYTSSPAQQRNSWIPISGHFWDSFRTN